MALKKIGHTFALVVLLGVSLPVHGQTRLPVVGTVRNERGELLASARVRATATDVDTTVRTNERGEFLVNLPPGNSTIAVSTLGYEEQRRNVAINATTGRVDFIMRAVAPTLAQVDVRENWIGIRGGVGDDSTRNPVAEATVIAPKQKIRLKTDANGRFEIPLPSIENTLLQIEQKGYKTRIVNVPIEKDRATDIILFLKPGDNVRGYKTLLTDMQRRAVANKQRTFMAGRAELAQQGAVTLYDAVIASGQLTKQGLRFVEDGQFCMLIDGKPRFRTPLSSIRLDDVEVVEVYGYDSEHTRTLLGEWPRPSVNTPCKDPGFNIPKADLKKYVEWVAVWLRK